MSSTSIGQLAPLAEPVRRALYEFVVAQPAPVDRDAAAVGVGVGRPLAAFHLDRLVAAGLLEVEYRRRSGRAGPGAGRPAKFYRRASGQDVHVSLPPRRYDLAAEILAAGLEAAPGARAAVLDAAQRRGREIADGTPGADDPRASLLDALAGHGYEPITEPEGTVLLRNCPFDALAREHRDLTCSMNLALLGSLAGQLEAAGLAAVAAPRDGYCCVALVPVQAAALP